MTRKELFKILFPEVYTEPSTCLGIACNNRKGCDECKYKNYWDEPAVLSTRAMKAIFNCTYGLTAPQYCDTDSIYFQYGGRGNGKTYAQHLALIHAGWSKFPSLHNNIEWSMLKDIIDDALDNGFEVKILNGSIYYREKQ